MFVLDISNALTVGPAQAPDGDEDRLKGEVLGGDALDLDQ